MVNIFKIKKSDTQPALGVTLEYNNGSAIDLTSSTIYFIMGNISDYTTYRSGLCTITAAGSGQCQYNWDVLDTGTAGTYWGEFQVTWSPGSVMTLPNNHNLKIEIFEDYN